MTSPLGWNRIAASRRRAGDRCARDVRSTSRSTARCNDAAVAAWGAKRAYQAPRPISMIRYLAFQGQSSDPKAASYSTDGLPLVPGLTKLVDGQVEVLSRRTLGRRRALDAAGADAAVAGLGRRRRARSRTPRTRC